MNTELIRETSLKSLAGVASFPQTVGALIQAGVEYYRMDYVARTATYYGADGSVAITPLNYEGLPAVAAEFDAVALKADVLDSQRNGQPYRDFSRRAMQAGVQSYTAFLRGKRVVYVGRQGDEHVEWFPGAQPATRQ
ncbi:MAG TPA: hypothetical protein VG710_08105 [Opitutus sp.]|nr:hypothetical protein [Opitutus sp.]